MILTRRFEMLPKCCAASMILQSLTAWHPIAGRSRRWWAISSIRRRTIINGSCGLVFPKYQQNDWVRVQKYDQVAWRQLIDLWEHYNIHLAHVIRNMPEVSLAVPCIIGDNEPVTLEFLMQDYVVHLKHHLNKIRERVGAT
jgi:hypothetical protein